MDTEDTTGKKKHPPLKKGIHILPSVFTTANGSCASYAFIAVFNDQHYVAAWAIVVALIFDVLDGRIARMTKTTSAFGAQYDSLADVVSFGVAPGLMMFTLMLKSANSRARARVKPSRAIFDEQ